MPTLPHRICTDKNGTVDVLAGSPEGLVEYLLGKADMKAVQCESVFPMFPLSFDPSNMLSSFGMNRQGIEVQDL